jgi:hypothetical protein
MCFSYYGEESTLDPGRDPELCQLLVLALNETFIDKAIVPLPGS